MIPLCGSLFLFGGIYCVYCFVRNLFVGKDADEETKEKWKKKIKIAAVVCVVGLIGRIAFEPSRSHESTGSQVEQSENALEQRKKEQEQKRKEEEALQKKYDDQKKYEEWLEWKKQEAERQAQKAEEERKSKEEQRRKEQERRRQEENKYQAINISTLLNEIRSNAARAKHNFNGKYLKMEGIVLTIESDGDNVVISDGEYNLIPAVHCMPSRNNKAVREKIFRLNKGQYVTVYGKVTNIGETMGCYFELEKIQ